MLEIFFEFQSLILSIVMLIGISRQEYLTRRIENSLRMLIAVTFVSSICYLAKSCYSGTDSEFAWWTVRVAEFSLNFIQYGQLLMIAVLIHQIHKINNPHADSRWLVIPAVVMMIEYGILIATQFTGGVYWFDSNNVYHQGPWIFWSSAMAVCGLLPGAVHVIRCKSIFIETLRYTLLSVYAILALFVALEGVFGHSLTVVGETLAMLFLYSIAIYEAKCTRMEREKTILQTRAYLENSMVNSHFIYNSLSVIQELIEENPKLAEETIGHLARFYRKDLNLKMKEGLISIKDEMQYVRDYLYIEGIRFEDDLTVVYEVDEELDFDIPFLSVQPLVDNAICHGIRGWKGKGTVTLRIFQENGQNIVEIQDDGAGFDPESLKEISPDGSRYISIGLRSVQERMKILCHGSLDIRSEKKKGTTVRIAIPVETRGD